jgi:hypothetical protein
MYVCKYNRHILPYEQEKPVQTYSYVILDSITAYFSRSLSNAIAYFREVYFRVNVIGRFLIFCCGLIKRKECLKEKRFTEKMFLALKSSNLFYVLIIKRRFNIFPV